MDLGPTVPVGVALQVGSLTIAADVLVAEPLGDGRERMAAALAGLKKDALESGLRVDSSPAQLEALFQGASERDRLCFLIELTLADPFAPCWFEMSRDRERERLNALRRLADRALSLDPESVRLIKDGWDRLVREEAGKSWGKYAKIGVGGLAVAGLAVAAGPLIAPLMPAAAGLSGAAAVSAGLAQLGFGSIAAGGLGMTGGMWMLGLAGGTLGVGGAAATQTITKDAVAAPGSGPWIQVELRKLVLSSRLAVAQGWFDASIDEFDLAVDNFANAVSEESKRIRAINDPKAARIAELERLEKAVHFAGEQMRALNSRLSRGSADS